MAMLTLAEAAKETGLTKPAIFKSIQKGRVSASKDEKGQWLIDPAELFRVYPPAVKKETEETQIGSLGLRLKLKAIEVKLEATEKRLLDKESEIENFRAQVGDLRSEREHWRVQAEQITRLLTDQREKEQVRKPGLWAWLTGKS
jgi:chromosome segregation ATPase